MKKTVIFMIAGILIVSVAPIPVEAATQNRSFKISITIPAVIGVNVFADTLTKQAVLTAPQTDHYENYTFRDGQPVLVRSAVVQ